MWGHSSDGRATRLQRVGRRFDPDWLHHTFFIYHLKDKTKYSNINYQVKGKTTRFDIYLWLRLKKIQ